jgi:hypothetical protein
MGAIYPDLDGLVVVDATGAKEQLNAEVWRHARRAAQRNLALVVEVYARSVLASRRLTEWWKSGDALMRDTLQGIYLLRVDLKKYGPEAVLRLTPYAVTGAPLFVGWNPIGQVCSRSQFDELTPEAMALPLSAFVEDVLARRPHTLNPVPSLGSAERTREAETLRRVAKTWKKPERVSAPTLDTATLDTAVQQDAVGAGDSEPLVLDGSEPAFRGPAPSESDATPTATDAAPAATAPSETQAEPIDDALDRLLTNARERFGGLEDHVGVPLRYQLSNLQAIDRWVDGLDDAARLEFAKTYGAVLAVYVGDTIRRNVTADWVWEAQREPASERLLLVGEVLGKPMQTAPLTWVVTTLSDASRSLYGQALGWCRVV